MCSPSFKSSGSVRRTERSLTRSPLISSPHQRSVRGDQPELVTDFWTPQAGLPQTVAPISRQREQTACWQFFFDQLFTWQTDQPRHATTTRGEPVESDRPRLASSPGHRLRSPGSERNRMRLRPGVNWGSALWRGFRRRMPVVVRTAPRWSASGGRGIRFVEPAVRTPPHYTAGFAIPAGW